MASSMHSHSLYLPPHRDSASTLTASVKVMRMAIEAVIMTLGTMRILLEAVRVHVDSIRRPEKSDFEASECLIKPWK
jgi:hypothetical protein